MSAESFAKSIAEGRFQPAYPELRDLTAIEIDDNLWEAEACYRALMDGTATLDEVDDPAARAWREFVAEVGGFFDVGRKPYKEYVCINEVLALGRRWFLDQWRFQLTPYGQALLRLEEEAKRLGIADQPDAVDALRRQVALEIAATGAKLLAEQVLVECQEIASESARPSAEEVVKVPVPAAGPLPRKTPKNIAPPPIADPKSLSLLLTSFEAAAILRCTVGAFYHMVDKLPDGIVRRRSNKPGSKLLIDRDRLLDYSENLPTARKNAQGIDIQKGKDNRS
jgi:hypothetical protein